MVSLKCTDMLELDLGYTILDCSSREYENQGRYFYLGMDSQLIQFKESDIDKVINLLNQVKALPLVAERSGHLK